MALFDLNRSNDTPIATLKLAEITPRNWPTLPPRIDNVTPAYVPVFTTAGGAPNTAPHTPVEHGTATVIVDERGIGDYTPRTQSDKAIALGLNFADPINTPFGWIAPEDPYSDPEPVSPDDDPVITTLTPSTAVVGQPSIICKITGTGFTPYSVVEVGGTNYTPATYVSPTELRFVIDTQHSVPGTIDVKVLDHNIKSAASPFIFT